MNDAKWDIFCKSITDIYNNIINNRTGEVANYIPALLNVDHDAFGISIYTINGRVFNIGDTRNKSVNIQSCSKPLSYALALREHGLSKVKEHVGREPSGSRFNAIVFDDTNRPYNPLINAGAIMSCSLIQNKESDDKRYEYIINTWKQIVGKDNVGFDNSIFLSEKLTAHRNNALAYLMMDNGVFPEHTDIEKTLQLYFQTCSITMSCESLTKFAALLANGGKTVDTGVEIFSSQIVRDVLCIMYSAGMYDFSGRWSFDIGLPAKSGVSGLIYTVIPNICGICVYSPRLDKYGNSVRGVNVFTQLTQQYRLHMFDTIINNIDDKKSLYTTPDKNNKLYNACKQNDSTTVKLILDINGFDINIGDYDGRTMLHIATDELAIDCIRILLDYGADMYVKDRWGNTPFKQALYNREIIILFNIVNYKRKVLRYVFNKLRQC
jgi:glutaminase